MGHKVELIKHWQCITMYIYSTSSDQGPATILIIQLLFINSLFISCKSTIQIVSTETKDLINSDTALLHALSCPIIMHLTNGSLSTFLKDVLAMKLFEPQGPLINV